MQSARRADRAPGADGGAGQPGLVRTLTMRTLTMRTLTMRTLTMRTLTMRTQNTHAQSRRLANPTHNQ